MKVSIDYIRWLASLTFCAVISIWAAEEKHNILQLLFGLLVYGAFVYEHGYKLDFKKEKQKLFFIFYVIPFGIAACSVAIRIS